jgi:hypothetical protein
VAIVIPLLIERLALGAQRRRALPKTANDVGIDAERTHA